MPKNSITARRLWIGCGIACLLNFPLFIAIQKTMGRLGRFVGTFFIIGWIFSWILTGIAGNLSQWMQKHSDSLGTLRLKWSKIGLLSFLCGINGLFVSTMILGHYTCDCCEKEHPQRKKSYPLLDANPRVSHWVNKETTLATFAYTLVILSVVSAGLFFFALLIFSIRFNFWLTGTILALLSFRKNAEANHADPL